MSRTAKSVVAGFDAGVMGIAAYYETGGTFTIGAAELVLWGAAVAAALCALIVFVDGSAVLAWAGIGYVLFGALLTNGGPHWALLALAVALMPLVPRPKQSLGLGLLVAVVAAIAARTLVAQII